MQLRFVAPGEDFVYSPDRPKTDEIPAPGGPKKFPVMFGVGGAVGAGVLAAVCFGVIRKGPSAQSLDNPTAAAVAPPTPPPPLIPPTHTTPPPTAVAAATPPPAPTPAAAPPPVAAAPAAVAPTPPPKPADSVPDGEIKIPDSAVAQADAIPPRNHTKSAPSESHPAGHHEKGREASESKATEKKVASATAPDAAAKKDTDDLRTQAEKSMADGDYDSAISKLRKVLKLDPNDALGHKLMGSCLASEGNLDEAASHYRRFVSLAPNDPQAPEDQTNPRLVREEQQQAVERDHLGIGYRSVHDEKDLFDYLALLLEGGLSGRYAHRLHAGHGEAPPAAVPPGSVLDMAMPGMTGNDVLTEIPEGGLRPGRMICTANPSLDTAVESLANRPRTMSASRSSPRRSSTSSSASWRRRSLLDHPKPTCTGPSATPSGKRARARTSP